MILYIQVLVLILVYCNGIHPAILHRHRHHTHNMTSTPYQYYPDKFQIWTINPHQLTITSAGFTIGANEPDWINHILGSKSVLFVHQGTHLQNHHMNASDIEQALKHGQSHFNYSSWQPCSYQFLGFAAVHHDNPFTVHYRRDKYSQPASGAATLTIHDYDIYNLGIRSSTIKPIDCYYRGLYENWRPESEALEVNHWVIMIYCPVSSKTSCEAMQSTYIMNRKLFTVFELSLSLHRKTWTTSIAISNKQLFQDRQFYISPPRAKHKLGACLVIPYRTSDTDKLAANTMLISSWMKYHILLGLKVFVYDRGGANMDAFTDYMHMKQVFVYHNFTIRGLLDSHSHHNLTYDNTMDLHGPSHEHRYASQGFDKSLTYSHCRFDAVVNHGIKHVLVADFDEFIYCPAANATAESQGRFLYDIVHHIAGNHKHQITFQQRILANKTSSVRQCVIDNIHHNQSLFDCVASYQYSYHGHSIKSFHLGNHCPMTGYHQACPTKELPRAYDCLCDSTAINPKLCGMMHISTRPLHYDRYHELLKDHSMNELAMTQSVNEVKVILEQSIDQMYRHIIK